MPVKHNLKVVAERGGEDGQLLLVSSTFNVKDSEADGYIFDRETKVLSARTQYQSILKQGYWVASKISQAQLAEMFVGATQAPSYELRSILGVAQTLQQPPKLLEEG